MSWPEARRRAHAAATALPQELVPLAEAGGRRLVADLTAPYDLPHFASSAMDGWLVVGEGPWTLTDALPHPGQARPVVTGQAIPIAELDAGTAAVLRSEHGETSSGMVRSVAGAAPKAGQHIRPIGSEAIRGETLISVGARLNPASLALAASAGVDALTVHAVPEIALVLTGDEVIGHGVPDTGFVRDSFSVPLDDVLHGLGARVTGVTRVGDDLAAITAAIQSASAPLILTTGGTGSSSADHLRNALSHLGGRLLVDGVAMRPGGPTMVAELPDGRLILCLPGNPLAAMVAAITLGEPLLAALSGRPMRAPRSIPAPDLAGRAATTLLVPYSITADGAVPTPWSGSAMMRGLAGADGLLVVPEAGLRADGVAESIDLPWVRPAR
ncbi:molybdopterin molybdotransferase MoeA [Naasia lichenicola]|uniref:Molybdopterin molybdenumtransferase n=1 Tax=Naasia lichenicola TaxID=2565933 RepID=A0A4S4FI82_9MICO|nr:molybdopterin molybdotransferase MoeA [Naasia lichenicola]THG29959.1 molybdopterin molybdotransferase MoeA [Naasia lichenicola]